MKAQKVAIIEERTYGLIVLNISKKAKEFIPMDKFIKRVNWGIYEIINACLVPKKEISIG